MSQSQRGVVVEFRAQNYQCSRCLNRRFFISSRYFSSSHNMLSCFLLSIEAKSKRLLPARSLGFAHTMSRFFSSDGFLHIFQILKYSAPIIGVNLCAVAVVCLAYALIKFASSLGLDGTSVNNERFVGYFFW